MRLVYLSPVPWSSFAQRPHKFVSWFHARTGGEVLWVNPYPTRFPLISDIQRLGFQAESESGVIPNWLSVVSPRAFPVEPLPGSGALNALLWSTLLREVDEFANSPECMVTIGKPSVLALTILKRLKTCKSIYDAMDDFPSFYTGLSKFAMMRRENQLARNVGVVMASSTAIQRHWNVIRTDVMLVRNGLDSNLLADFVRKPLVEGKKVLGYLGTIASWFDWNWVVELAKLRPLDVVRLIGPMYSSVPPHLPKNIEILPACSHQEAVAAMKLFDVGLIPFVQNSLTASVDPIKYYEYRALGVPVISTEFGEMKFRNGEEGTFLSQGLQDISTLIKQALNFKATEKAIQQFRSCNSWEFRFSGANII